MTRKSIFERSGLPKEFGVILLTFGLILSVSPYVPPGFNLSSMSVPQFDQEGTQKLKVFAPPLFVGIILLFVPIWKDKSDEATSKSRIKAEEKSISLDVQVLDLQFKISQVTQIQKQIKSFSIKLIELKNKINNIDKKEEEYVLLIKEFGRINRMISDLTILHDRHSQEFHDQLNQMRVRELNLLLGEPIRRVRG